VIGRGNEFTACFPFDRRVLPLTMGFSWLVIQSLCNCYTGRRSSVSALPHWTYKSTERMFIKFGVCGVCRENV